jgi:hypothetical protein
VSLTPIGHPDRAQRCNNLASSLHTRFQHRGDQSLLDKAITLKREALSLTPIGHPDRAQRCGKLASSLYTRFQHRGDQSLLDEAITLKREALSLTPVGHPDKAERCRSLAVSLHTRFNIHGDSSLLLEARTLCEEALDILPKNHPQQWRTLLQLSRIHLNQHSSQCDLDCVIVCLQRAISPIVDSFPDLLSQCGNLIARLNPLIVPDPSRHRLLKAISNAIDLASMVSGFVLDRESQLRRLEACQQIGSCAYLCAALCGRKELGLELVEQSRAVIWSQSLYMRDPQLENIPSDIANELKQLFQHVSATNLVDISDHTLSYLTTQDVRYRHNTRIEQLIRQTRLLPGRERFMRGLTFDQLACSAADHAVVILVAGHEQCRALILQSKHDQLEEICLNNIASDDLQDLLADTTMIAPRTRGAASDEAGADERGMKVSHSPTPFTRALKRLWAAVVKPVLNHLRLVVSIIKSNFVIR